MRSLALLVAVLAALACRPAARAPDANPIATPNPNPTATAPPIWTGTPAASAPPAAPILDATALDPSGPARLSFVGETVVDPAASFRVEVAHAFPDGRLVLLDGAQAIVASRGTREVGATATAFTLAPAEPLVPASRYLLRLEGVAGRDLHDAAGAAYGPVAAAILVAGSPPEPAPKPAPRRRRGRR